MLGQLLQSRLDDALGHLVENIDTHKFRVGLLKGRLTLENVKLRDLTTPRHRKGHRANKRLGSPSGSSNGGSGSGDPVTLAGGHIRTMRIDLPWMSGKKKEPPKILMEGVTLRLHLCDVAEMSIPAVHENLVRSAEQHLARLLQSSCDRSSAARRVRRNAAKGEDSSSTTVTNKIIYRVLKRGRLVARGVEVEILAPPSWQSTTPREDPGSSDERAQAEPQLRLSVDTLSTEPSLGSHSLPRSHTVPYCPVIRSMHAGGVTLVYGGQTILTPFALHAEVKFLLARQQESNAPRIHSVEATVETSEVLAKVCQDCTAFGWAAMRAVQSWSNMQTSVALRPTEPVRGNARQWWQYALAAVRLRQLGSTSCPFRGQATCHFVKHAVSSFLETAEGVSSIDVHAVTRKVLNASFEKATQETPSPTHIALVALSRAAAAMGADEAPSREKERCAQSAPSPRQRRPSLRMRIARALRRTDSGTPARPGYTETSGPNGREAPGDTREQQSSETSPRTRTPGTVEGLTSASSSDGRDSSTSATMQNCSSERKLSIDTRISGMEDMSDDSDTSSQWELSSPATGSGCSSPREFDMEGDSESVEPPDGLSTTKHSDFGTTTIKLTTNRSFSSLDPMILRIVLKVPSLRIHIDPSTAEEHDPATEKRASAMVLSVQGAVGSLEPLADEPHERHSFCMALQTFLLHTAEGTLIASLDGNIASPQSFDAAVGKVAIVVQRQRNEAPRIAVGDADIVVDEDALYRLAMVMYDPLAGREEKFTSYIRSSLIRAATLLQGRCSWEKSEHRAQQPTIAATAETVQVTLRNGTSEPVSLKLHNVSTVLVSCDSKYAMEGSCASASVEIAGIQVLQPVRPSWSGTLSAALWLPTTLDVRVGEGECHLTPVHTALLLEAARLAAGVIQRIAFATGFSLGLGVHQIKSHVAERAILASTRSRAATILPYRTGPAHCTGNSQSTAESVKDTATLHSFDNETSTDRQTIHTNEIIRVDDFVWKTLLDVPKTRIDIDFGPLRATLTRAQGSNRSPQCSVNLCKGECTCAPRNLGSQTSNAKSVQGRVASAAEEQQIQPPHSDGAQQRDPVVLFSAPTGGQLLYRGSAGHAHLICRLHKLRVTDATNESDFRLGRVPAGPRDQSGACPQLGKSCTCASFSDGERCSVSVHAVGTSQNQMLPDSKRPLRPQRDVIIDTGSVHGKLAPQTAVVLLETLLACATCVRRAALRARSDNQRTLDEATPVRALLRVPDIDLVILSLIDTPLSIRFLKLEARQRLRLTLREVSLGNSAAAIPSIEALWLVSASERDREPTSGANIASSIADTHDTQTQSEGGGEAWAEDYGGSCGQEPTSATQTPLLVAPCQVCIPCIAFQVESADHIRHVASAIEFCSSVLFSGGFMRSIQVAHRTLSAWSAQRLPAPADASVNVLVDRVEGRVCTDHDVFTAVEQCVHKMRAQLPHTYTDTAVEVLCALWSSENRDSGVTLQCSSSNEARQLRKTGTPEAADASSGESCTPAPASTQTDTHGITIHMKSVNVECDATSPFSFTGNQIFLRVKRFNELVCGWSTIAVHKGPVSNGVAWKAIASSHSRGGNAVPVFRVSRQRISLQGDGREDNALPQPYQQRIDFSLPELHLELTYVANASPSPEAPTCVSSMESDAIENMLQTLAQHTSLLSRLTRWFFSREEDACGNPSSSRSAPCASTTGTIRFRIDSLQCVARVRYYQGASISLRMGCALSAAVQEAHKWNVSYAHERSLLRYGDIVLAELGQGSVSAAISTTLPGSSTVRIDKFHLACTIFHQTKLQPTIAFLASVARALHARWSETSCARRLPSSQVRAACGQYLCYITLSACDVTLHTDDGATIGMVAIDGTRVECRVESISTGRRLYSANPAHNDTPQCSLTSEQGSTHDPHSGQSVDIHNPTRFGIQQIDGTVSLRLLLNSADGLSALLPVVEVRTLSLSLSQEAARISMPSPLLISVSPLLGHFPHILRYVQRTKGTESPALSLLSQSDSSYHPVSVRVTNALCQSLRCVAGQRGKRAKREAVLRRRISRTLVVHEMPVHDQKIAMFTPMTSYEALITETDATATVSAHTLEAALVPGHTAAASHMRATIKRVPSLRAAFTAMVFSSRSVQNATGEALWILVTPKSCDKPEVFNKNADLLRHGHVLWLPAELCDSYRVWAAPRAGTTTQPQYNRVQSQTGPTDRSQKDLQTKDTTATAALANIAETNPANTFGREEPAAPRHRAARETGSAEPRPSARDSSGGGRSRRPRHHKQSQLPNWVCVAISSDETELRAGLTKTAVWPRPSALPTGLVIAAEEAGEYEAGKSDIRIVLSASILLQNALPYTIRYRITMESAAASVEGVLRSCGGSTGAHGALLAPPGETLRICFALRKGQWSAPLPLRQHTSLARTLNLPLAQGGVLRATVATDGSRCGTARVVVFASHWLVNASEVPDLSLEAAAICNDAAGAATAARCSIRGSPWNRLPIFTASPPCIARDIAQALFFEKNQSWREFALRGEARRWFSADLVAQPAGAQSELATQFPQGEREDLQESVDCSIATRRWVVQGAVRTAGGVWSTPFVWAQPQPLPKPEVVVCPAADCAQSDVGHAFVAKQSYAIQRERLFGLPSPRVCVLHDFIRIVNRTPFSIAAAGCGAPGKAVVAPARTVHPGGIGVPLLSGVPLENLLALAIVPSSLDKDSSHLRSQDSDGKEADTALRVGHAGCTRARNVPARPGAQWHLVLQGQLEPTAANVPAAPITRDSRATTSSSTLVSTVVSLQPGRSYQRRFRKGRGQYEDMTIRVLPRARASDCIDVVVERMSTDAAHIWIENYSPYDYFVSERNVSDASRVPAHGSVHYVPWSGQESLEEDAIELDFVADMQEGVPHGDFTATVGRNPSITTIHTSMHVRPSVAVDGRMQIIRIFPGTVNQSASFIAEGPSLQRNDEEVPVGEQQHSVRKDSGTLGNLSKLLPKTLSIDIAQVSISLFDGRGEEILHTIGQGCSLSFAQSARCSRISGSLRAWQIDPVYRPALFHAALAHSSPSERAAPALSCSLVWEKSDASPILTISECHIVIARTRAQLSADTVARALSTAMPIALEWLRTSKRWFDTSFSELGSCQIFLDNLHIESIPCELQYSASEEISWSAIRAARSCAPAAEPCSRAADDRVHEMMTRVLNSVPSIDKTDLLIPELRLSHTHLSLSALIGLAATIYRRSLEFEIARLIGSVRAIGNPVGFMQDLGHGVASLWNEPARALAERRSLAAGLASGAGALVQSSVHGVANTAHNVTRALADTMDTVAPLPSRRTSASKYSTADGRRVSQHESATGSGIRRFASGIWHGAAGPALDPINGARTRGASGFFSGLVSGLAGIATRPLSGALHLVAGVASDVRAVSRTPAPMPAWVRPPREYPPSAASRAARSHEDVGRMLLRALCNVDEQTIHQTHNRLHSRSAYRFHTVLNVPSRGANVVVVSNTMLVGVWVAQSYGLSECRGQIFSALRSGDVELQWKVSQHAILHADIVQTAQKETLARSWEVLLHVEDPEEPRRILSFQNKADRQAFCTALALKE